MNEEDLRGRFRRDFTAEPIPSRPASAPIRPLNQTASQAPSAPVAQAAPPVAATSLPQLDLPPAPSSNRPIKSSRRQSGKRITVVFTVILLCLAASGLAVYQSKKSQPAVPVAIQSKSQIPVLYPSKLPAGFALAKSSFNIAAGNIVAYYAANQSGQHLNFTVQPRPANFDFEKFYSQIISNSTRFNTTLGEAAVGKANGHLLGSLATTNSWVIVTGNSKSVSAADIQFAISNLKAATKN